MKKAVQILLKTLSDPESKLDIEKSRKLMNLKTLDPFKVFYKTLDIEICNGQHSIPVRIYFPDEKAEPRSLEENVCPVLLYIHGGGFVTESVESYNRVCRNLAKHTGHMVVSVEYPLAPEHHFPRQVEDCYAVARAIYTDSSILNVAPEKITIMGDSAGGNLVAAVSMMARDRGEFLPTRQILIYPCLNNNYEENNGYASVVENGNDYFLTRQNMKDYLEYYQSDNEDRRNPYFAPLLAEDFHGLPPTLIITGELDLLRDEGEDYAKKLSKAGVTTVCRRIRDGIHGFFLLEPLHHSVKETYGYINEFLKET